MSCVVKWCKNRSDRRKKNPGITFHRFSIENEVWRNDWIEIIRNCNNESDWIPHKYSVICSLHFEANDLYTTKGGSRRVVTYAVPKKFLSEAAHMAEEQPVDVPDTSTASQEVIEISEASHIEETLRVCRGCLATDARLYDMHQNHLMDAYIRLVQVTEDLPTYLCSYCAVLLLKYDTFRVKCIDSLLKLRNAQLYNGQLTLQHVKQINTHCTTYNQSEILTLNIGEIDINDNDSTDSYEPEHDIDNDTSDTDTINEKANIKTQDNSTNKDLKGERDPLCDQMDYILIKIEPDCHDNDNMESSNNDLHKITHEKQHTTEVNAQKMELESNENCIFEDNVVNMESEESDDYFKDDNDEETVIDKDSKIIERNRGRRSKYTRVDYEKISKEYNMSYTFLKTKDDRIRNFQEILNSRRQSDNYELGTYKCDVCYKGFVKKEAYINHMDYHDEGSGKLLCDICNLYYDNRSSFRAHLARHSRRLACKDCEYTTDFKTSAYSHFLRHGGFKYSCKLCDKKLNGRSSYYAHLKVVHPTSDELIRCELCGDSFCGATGLRQHERMAHKEMKSPECLCSGCDTQFYCSDAFKAHQGTDGLCDTLHKYCVRCGMSFETEELLKEHEIEQRKPRDEFKCEVCTKVFYSYSAYNIHRKIHYSKLELKQYRKRYRSKRDSQQTKMSKEVPHLNLMCELCGIISKTKIGLQVHHMNKHSNIRPYECTVCEKSFKHKMSLKFHRRIHTGERPYQCELCHKTFSNPTNLNRHKIVHTGERPFACDVCTKSFTTKHCVQMHIKTVHMREPMPPRNRRKIKKKT